MYKYYLCGVEFSGDHLMHHGILGMKWGIRRYQNKDGTLTEAGKERYLKKIKKEIRENHMTRHYSVDKNGVVYVTESQSSLKHLKKSRDMFKELAKHSNFKEPVEKIKSGRKDLEKAFREDNDLYKKYYT